jgi:Transposase DDE domain
MPRRFKRSIRAVDPSTIMLVANCMDWAKHRRQKAAAKLYLQLDLQTFLSAFAVVDTARRSDPAYARKVCANLREGEIVTFDKAYVDLDHLCELDERGVFWVARAKDIMDYRCVKRLQKKRVNHILHDDLIVLNGATTRKKYPQCFRRVVAFIEIDGKLTEMTFITNNLDWAAASIADLRKSRWTVEVFFKEIKQALQLCDFLGHSKNAILWQVWRALLLHLLLRYLSFVHGWSHGLKRLFCVLRSCIWHKFLLRNLLKSCETAYGYQLRQKYRLRYFAESLSQNKIYKVLIIQVLAIVNQWFWDSIGS